MVSELAVSAKVLLTEVGKEIEVLFFFVPSHSLSSHLSAFKIDLIGTLNALYKLQSRPLGQDFSESSKNVFPRHSP